MEKQMAVTVTKDELIKIMAESSAEILGEAFKEDPILEIAMIGITGTIAARTVTKLFKEEK